MAQSTPLKQAWSVIWKGLLFLVLFGYLVVVVSLLLLFYTSLKDDRAIFMSPFSLPDFNHLQWGNFQRAWVGAHFSRYFFNSALVTTTALLVSLLLAAMAAYALSRFRLPGGSPVFYLFSAALHGAGQIDGCSEWRAFWSIMLPLARPGLITVAIFQFLGFWNEFFTAFLFMSGAGSEQIRTLPLGLASIAITSQYRSDWGTAFAGLVLVTIPTLIFYVLLQRHLVKGITMGALKG